MRNTHIFSQILVAGFLLFGGLLFSGGSLLATDNSDSLYTQALKLYEEGRYEAAMESWELLVEEGNEAAILYYNMGNAAYRSNNIGKAILYYEKTLQLNPGHGDAMHNLEFVSRYKVDAFEEVPTFFLRTWMHKLVKALPEKAWSIMALTFLVLSLAALLLYIFTRGLTLKKLGFFLALIGLILFFFTLGAALRSHRDVVKPHSAIVLHPSVVIRSTPSESGTDLFILHEGTRIELKEAVGDWYNIRIVDGREGWIPARAMGVI